MKKHNLRNQIFLYSMLFLILAAIVFFPFIQQGRSLVWYFDGLDQHLPMLKNYGSLLRGLLSGKGFSMIDFELGLGFDTISTLHYYVMGDPLTLLSVFATENNAVIVYNILTLLRYYLAGISFILFARYLRKNNYAAVVGAFIYIFSGYTLFAGIRHPFFMNPLIYLPLLIIGVEQVLRNKKPYILIAIVCISASSNFYFFFDLTVIAVVYFLFRYFYIYRKTYKGLSGFLFIGFKTGLNYLLGLMLSCVLFVPVVYAFLNNGRLERGPELLISLFHYNRKYYINFFQGLIAPGVSMGYWTILSFTPVIVVSFAILLCHKKYRQLQIAYLLTLVGLFVPAFGYFMNGFAYIANRWCFLVNLLIALTFLMTYDKFFRLEKKEKLLLLLGVIGYGVLAFAFPSSQMVKYTFYFLILLLVLMFLLHLKWFQNKESAKAVILSAVILISLAFTGNAYYSPRYKDYAGQFLTQERIDKLTHKGILTLIPQIKDASFYRIDTVGDYVLNGAPSIGYNDVSAYFSLVDGNIANYMGELESVSQNAGHRFSGFDNSTILNNLASVKYFVTNDKSKVPYGYELLKETETGKCLYLNTHALPLGYTYDHYILKEDYDALNALEKQKTLIQAVVLESPTDFATTLGQEDIHGARRLEVELIPDENVIIEDGIIRVKKAGASLKLLFDSPANSETYIRLGEFKLEKKQGTTRMISVVGETGVRKEFKVKTIYYNSYAGKDDFLVNIGYSTTGQTSAVITFLNKDRYSFDSIEAYSLDMTDYPDLVATLKQNTLQNIRQTKNRIAGDVNLDKKGVLTLSIPYSRGWTAYVDGVRTDIQKGNVMFMSLPLEAGEHHLVLKYRTPGLLAGSIITGVAILILIAGVYLSKTKKKAFKC